MTSAYGYQPPRGMTLKTAFFNRKGDRYRFGVLLECGGRERLFMAECPATRPRRAAKADLQVKLAAMVREAA